MVPAIFFGGPDNFVGGFEVVCEDAGFVDEGFRLFIHQVAGIAIPCIDFYDAETLVATVCFFVSKIAGIVFAPAQVRLTEEVVERGVDFYYFFI